MWAPRPRARHWLVTAFAAASLATAVVIPEVSANMPYRYCGDWISAQVTATPNVRCSAAIRVYRRFQAGCYSESRCPRDVSGYRCTVTPQQPEGSLVLCARGTRRIRASGA